MAITGFKNFIPRNDSNLYIYDTSKREEKNITDFSGDFITIENNEFGSNGANIGQTYCDSFQEIKKMSIDYDDYIKNPSKYSYIKNNNLSLDIKSLFQNSLIFSSSEIKKMKNIKLNFLNFKIEALKKIRDLNSEMEKLIKLSPHTSVIEESNKNELRFLNQEIEKLENNKLDSMSPKMLSNILYQLETNGIILNYDDIIYYDYLSNEIYLKCGLIVKVTTGLFYDIESIKNVNTDTEYILDPHTSKFKRINDNKNKTNYLIKDGITYAKIEHKNYQEEFDNMKSIINFKDDSDIKINGCAEVYIKGEKINVYQLGDISDETFLEQIEDINTILNDFPENAYKTIVSNKNFKGFVCLSDDYIDLSTSDYNKRGLTFAGLCYTDNYIALNNKDNKMCTDATTTHELCHLFGSCNRSNNNFCVTCQQEFIDLYNEYKIKIQPSINSGYGNPKYYPEGVPNIDEFFAVTGELYINDPDTLSTLFPDIYNYLDEVFSGNIE